MRMRAALLGLAVITACGGSSPPPHPESSRWVPRDIDEELRSIRDQERFPHESKDSQEDRVRAIFERYDPMVTIEPVPDDELVTLLGGHMARRIRRLGVVIRTVTKPNAQPKEGMPFPYSTQSDIAFEGKSGRLLRHDTDGNALANFTGERYPHGHSQPISGSTGPATTGEAIVGTLLFPVSILGRPTSTTVPPTEAEIMAAAPHAGRAVKALATDCYHGGCKTYLIYRRPADPTIDLEMNLTVSTGTSSIWGTASITVPLPKADSLEERIRLAGSTRRILAEPGVKFELVEWNHIFKPQCYPENGITWEKRPWQSPPCETADLLTPDRAEMQPLGLTVPSAPTLLGTWTSSEAKRPSWAKPGIQTPPWAQGAQMQGARAEYEASLLVCETDKLWGNNEQEVTHVEIEKESSTRRPVLNWQTPDINHTWHYSTIFPLMYIKPEGRVKLVYTDETGSPLVRFTVQRKGLEVETKVSPKQKVPPKCTFVERKKVEAMFVSAWATAMDWLDAIPEKPIERNADDADDRIPVDPVGAAKVQIADCAMLVGWDDPRVVDLVTRLEREEKRIREALAAAKPAQP